LSIFRWLCPHWGPGIVIHDQRVAWAHSARGPRAHQVFTAIESWPTPPLLVRDHEYRAPSCRLEDYAMTLGLQLGNIKLEHRGHGDGWRETRTPPPRPPPLSRSNGYTPLQSRTIFSRPARLVAPPAATKEVGTGPRPRPRDTASNFAGGPSKCATRLACDLQRCPREALSFAVCRNAPFSLWLDLNGGDPSCPSHEFCKLECPETRSRPNVGKVRARLSRDGEGSRGCREKRKMEHHHPGLVR